MYFNLLYPFWMVLTVFLDLGADKAKKAANKAEIAKLEFDFALRFQIACWLIKCYHNLDVVVVDGFRSDAEQDALHAKDKRNPPASRGRGRSHQAGEAADVNFWRNGVPVLLKGTPAASWQPVYKIFAECGLQNGSTFPGYPDNNHIYKS